MKDIIGHGGGKGGGASHTHYEAPDSLHSTAYARVLDLVSEGEILGLAEGTQSVYLNNTPVTNSDGSSNFKNVSIDFRTGTQDQDYIAGFPDVESEVTVGLELKYGTPWVHAIGNTALSAVRITLGVDQMYKTDTDNGDVGGTSVSYSIELSTDGGAYKTVLSNSFSGKTMSAYQRTARIDLPPATSGWQIRVTRLTPNSTLASIADKTKIISYTEVIDAKLRYPMSAIVGIQLDATQFQAVPTRAYDLFGRVIQVPSNYDAKTRTYTGTWDGTFKPSWTDNPAWVFRDLALHDRYGLGNRITTSQVDKWALYKIARYCDEMVPNGKGGTEPRFTCNLYLQSRKQAYAVLQDIAAVFRGISYWGAGSIIASADMPSDPVYIYTAANVIGGKFTRTGTKKSTRYTVALVTWNDPADFYKQKVEYVEDREGIARYGIQQVELTAFGCTSQGQAQRAGRWALATSRLETEGITFDVGMDGAIALPGQVVRIADPSRMGRRVGGRVRTAVGRVVTLDKAPVINVGDQLTVVLPTGVSETHAVAAVSGDSVTINADWTTLPVAQSVWSIDSNELMAPLYRVLSVTEKDEVTFTITAVQHEPGKYDFVEKGTAITPRNQTSLDVTKQAPPTSVALTGYTISLNDVQKLALQVSCAPVAGAVAYEGAYRRGNDNWIAIPRQPSPTMDVLDVLPGTYMAKMAAVNSIGVTSVETQSVAVEIARDGVSKNADVLLTSDVAYFHTDTNGVTDPSTITFTASLIALDGPVTWGCVGGTLTNKTATTAQLAFADATAASITVTASVTAFGRTYSRSLTVRKVQDGASGSDGLQTDVARLYQWAPVKPAKPTGASTFNWTGLTNTGYTGTDGWANPAPDSGGQPGWRLYVASVGVSAAIAATSSPVSYTNATIEAWSQNGANGANGVQSREATVYRWDVSIPAGPTGPATFKWADGTFGAAPANWTLTPGNAPSLGMTLFAATVQVVDSAASATTAFNWQSAAVMAIGYVGTNGGPGAQGASYVTAYIASSAIAANGAPAPTTGKNSLPAANSSGLAGAWSASVPTLADGQRQYQTDGIYDPTTDKVTWSIPYWSSLKVATLSAITANLGAINAGSMNLGNGTFTVDNSGNVVMSSWRLVDPNTGRTVMQAGGKLSPEFAAAGTLNTDQQWSDVKGPNKPQDNATVGANASNFTGVVGGDNLCPNSSFEVATNGVLADGWVIYNNNPSGEPATSSIETGRLSGKSLAVSWQNGHNATKGIQRAGAVPQWMPNATYIVSFYAKTSNLSSTSDMALQWNVWPASTVALMNPNLSTSWQRYAFKITWGASVEGVGALYLSVAYGAGGGNVYFDDVMVVEGDVLPAYYPSTAEAKQAADAANAAIANISSDSVLSKGEKADVVVRWQACDSELQSLKAQASVLNVSSTTYQDAHFALSNYLISLSPGWNDSRYDTAIDPTTWQSKWNAYYDQKQKLINAMTAAASNTSTWAGVIGTGKPEDGANFIPLGRGTALNEDPTIEKLSSWVLTGNTTYRTSGGGTNAASNRYFGSTAEVLNSLAYSRSAVAIDPNKTYSLTANLYQTSNDRAIWLFVDFYDASGNWFSGDSVSNGGTGWGGGHSGYTFGGVPPGDQWTRCGGQFGAGTARPIPTNARTVVVGVWFNYNGSGSTSSGGLQAAQDIRLEPVIGMALIDPTFQANLQDKISKTAASALQAPITLATNGLILSGDTNNGTYQSPGGFFAVRNGAYTVAIPISGEPSFAGNITAKSGTLGSLTLASGGYIARGYYGTWDWNAKAPGPGFLIHENGMLFGDYNDSNYGYVQISSSGGLSMPGFSYAGRQLTLTSPVLVNPKTTTSFSASIATVRITNQTPNVRVSTGIGVSLSGGSGASGYSYQWVFNSDTGGGSNAINATGLLSNASLSITAQCSAGWYYASASVTVTDIATGATARASVRISIQFGSGAEA